MQRQLCLALIGVTGILITSSVAIRGEADLPDPGQLLVTNGLSLVSGNCVGNVSIHYGYLPIQKEREWSTRIDSETCAITVWEAAGGGLGVPTWAPVGHVYAHPFAEATRCSPCVTSEIYAHVGFDYGAGAACPPTLLGVPNPTYDPPWVVVDGPHGGSLGCATAYRFDSEYFAGGYKQMDADARIYADSNSLNCRVEVPYKAPSLFAEWGCRPTNNDVAGTLGLPSSLGDAIAAGTSFLYDVGAG